MFRWLARILFQLGVWLHGDDEMGILKVSSESATALFDAVKILQAARFRVSGLDYVVGPPIVYSACFEAGGDEMTDEDIAALVAQINARTEQLKGVVRP